DAADDRALGQVGAVLRAGLDREELLAEHALGGDVEERVLADALLVPLLDDDLQAHERIALAAVHDLAAAELDLADLADLDAGDLHGRAGLEAAGVVELDVDGIRRLEVDAAHDDDERGEQ